ncbi:zinc finger, CCHC-type containing protein [Tanacetum coccineum]
MGDENPIRTLGDYSKPSHEGYRNIELPEGNNVVPLRFDTIWLGKNVPAFISISLCDQASNWLERLPAGSISTWEDLTTRFLAQFFPPGRTAKLRNDILMFSQQQGESISEAWTRFKDLLQKVSHHGIDLCSKSKYFMTMSIPPQDEPSINQPVSIFSLCYLFRNPFSLTSMGDENPIRTLGDYSKPSHEGYRNIELPEGNNVVPLRSDTIRLVQNGCSFHGLRSKDPNQHLMDFLKLVDSLDLNGDNRERTCLRLFLFSLCYQASNWLERLPAGSISTLEDLTTRFLAHFFPPGRTTKLRNDILMFSQQQGESLFEAWTRFKDLLQKVSHHGIDLCSKSKSFMTMSIPP